MQGQLLLRPYRKLMEEGRLLAVVIEQWNGKRLDIYFHWTNICMDCKNKRKRVAFMPLRLEPAKILWNIKG